MKRCKWVNLNNPLYIEYHDNEWGIPSYSDRHLFEMLVLESFQAGLSWECILNKRKYFKESCDDFDYQKIALYEQDKIVELLNNKNIIRNKLKIKAMIKNAKIFINITDEYGSFSNYLWHYTDYKVIKGKGDLTITHNELSDKISSDLYQRGMRFVGSVIIYSYLQAVGVIDDHEPSCYKF